MQGVLYLGDHTSAMLGNWIVGLALTGSGLLLLLGLLTPLASAVTVLTTVCVGAAWLPAPRMNFLNASLPVALVVVVAISVGFLGPGAFSIDSRLFGRREIVIPRKGPAE